MKKYFFSLLTTIFFLAIAFSSVSVATSAANLSDAFNKNENKPLGGLAKQAGYSPATGLTSLQDMIAKLIQGALSVIGVVFLILMIYGGFLWMTDRGSEAQVKKAINLIQSAVIGLIIVVAAYAITYFVVQTIGKGQLTSIS